MSEDRYVSTAEVAQMLHVSPKTVTRWASLGKLPHMRTLGGHRRFSTATVERIARELTVEVDPELDRDRR